MYSGPIYGCGPIWLNGLVSVDVKLPTQHTTTEAAIYKITILTSRQYYYLEYSVVDNS